MLPHNHIEYYVIANVTPKDPERPLPITLWPTKPTQKLYSSLIVIILTCH